MQIYINKLLYTGDKMIDITALGLAICLATVEIDCDKVSYEFNDQLRKKDINGQALHYPKSNKQKIIINSKYKNKERITTNILIHELAHVLVTQQGGSHKHNAGHKLVFKNACKQLLETLDNDLRDICRTAKDWG